MYKTILTAVLVSLVIISVSCTTTSQKIKKYEASGDGVKLAGLLAQEGSGSRSKLAVWLAMGYQESHGWQIQEALLRLKDPRSVEPLIEVLNTRSGGYMTAAIVLGRMRDPRAVESLVIALRDEYPPLRQRAAEALGIIGDPRAVEPLVNALKDERQWIREEVVTALGNIGDSRAAEPLIYVLKYDPDYKVRVKTVEAVVRCGGTRAVEPLIAALKDKREEVRMEAGVALGKIGDKRAVEPLIAALKDKNPGVQRCAAEALGRIGDPRAGDGLVALLSDGETWPKTAENAAWALEKIGDPRAASAFDVWKMKDAKRAQEMKMRKPQYNRKVQVSLSPGAQFNLPAGMDVSRVFSGLNVVILLEEPMTIVYDYGGTYAIDSSGLSVPAAVFNAKTADGKPAMVFFNRSGTPHVVIQWNE